MKTKKQRFTSVFCAQPHGVLADGLVPSISLISRNILLILRQAAQ